MGEEIAGWGSVRGERAMGEEEGLGRDRWMGEMKTQRLGSVKQPTCYRVRLGCFAIGCRQ